MRRSVLVLSCFFLPAVALAAGPTFTLIDLGPGPTSASDAPGGWGLSWTPWLCQGYGVPALRGLNLPAYTCAANSVAEVGYSPVEAAPNNDIIHAFLFRFHPQSAGPTMDLGTLGGDGAISSASSLNSAGTAVVGYSWLGPPEGPPWPPLHAFLWRPSTGMTDLGTFKNGDSSEYNSFAYEVNDALQVVGTSDNLLSTGSVAERAALWEGGQIYELQYQLTGVKVNSVILTNALGISCSGQIAAVGYPASGSSTVTHTYLLIRPKRSPARRIRE